MDQQTNTSLNLTRGRPRERADHVARHYRSRDKNTATNLVLGAKKRRPRPPHRRLMEHEAAPGSQRRETPAETQIRDSVETVMMELRERGEVVLEIKVGNSEELILDSMRESPEGQETIEEIPKVIKKKTVEAKQRSTYLEVAQNGITELSISQTSLDVLTTDPQNTDPDLSPLQTTAIEDVLSGIQSQESVEIVEGPELETAPKPQTSKTNLATTPTTPGFDGSPMTPMSPGAGFEWCDEYEYELVEEGEEEEEEALQMDLEFDLESPEANKELD